MTPRRRVNFDVDAELRISYGSILSVCIDARPSASVACQLFFTVRHPPRLYRKYRRQPRNNLFTDRAFIFKNESVSTQIANSSVFCLRISSRSQLTSVVEAMLRLCERSDAALLFAPVEHTPWSLPAARPSTFHSFSANFCFEALQSRGAAVRDQLLTDGNVFARFTQAVARRLAEQRKAAETALERLLDALDERRHVVLLDAFERIYAALRGGSLRAFSTDVPDNCVVVRKAIVTPTRRLLLPAEVQMGNRVVRTFGDDEALRVIFRDENCARLPSTTYSTSAYSDGDNMEIEKRYEDAAQVIRTAFEEGLRVAGRHYRFLAWSNSQLRDHACYFYAPMTNRLTGRKADIYDIREWLGDFTAFESVSKMMSRMGQSFTQARNSVSLQDEGIDYEVDRDVIGTQKNPETNEDYNFSDGIGRMSEATRDQICVMLKLPTHTSAFQVRYGGFKGMLAVDPILARQLPHAKVAFRDSMNKYLSDNSKVLEIVKHSSVAPVTLNKPLIMILDQASEWQDKEVHKRVAGRIYELLEQHLSVLAEMLSVEMTAAEQLNARITSPMDFFALRRAGVRLTSEPFFRRLLAAVYRYNIDFKLPKMKIDIPLTVGRSMFGVLDETGRLRNGEVFVQYSDGCDYHTLHGRVLVTKNPCVVAGDVRMLTAVDEQALRHHFDVIVFPRVGDRPHADEMAGSDLDGDEFSVFWDSALLLDKSEPPMDFPKQKPVPRPVLESHIVEFFLHFIFHDMIGSLCNAHMAHADGLGLRAKMCGDIAFKCAISVDFAKSGKGCALIVEERPRKWPDFMQKRIQPAYESKRLLGQLFRRVQRISDAFHIAQCQSAPTLRVDEQMLFAGRERFKGGAVEVYKDYSNALQWLVDTYGIVDEASLVSGHVVHLRSRISERDREDFSFYNTDQIVRMRLGKVVECFREQFFEEFNGGDMYLSSASGGRRRVEYATDEMLAKASAWYEAAYAGDGRFLSFAWIVWDVLVLVKEKAMLHGSPPQLDPVPERLGAQMDEYARRHAAGWLSEARRRCPQIDLYCANYDGFDKLYAAVVAWAKAEGCLTTANGSGVDEERLGRLLFECGLRCPVDRHADHVFLPTVVSAPLPTKLQVNGGTGRFLLAFFKWASSQKVAASLSALAGAASRAHHVVALSGRLAALDDDWAAADEHRETEPIAFRCDETYSDEALAEVLKKLSGAAAVCVRRPRDYRPDLAVASGFGAIASGQRLRSVLCADDLGGKLAAELGCGMENSLSQFDDSFLSDAFDSFMESLCGNI